MKRESFFECVDEAAAWVQERAGVKPLVAVVLSAGLGGLTESIASPTGNPPAWPTTQLSSPWRRSAACSARRPAA